MSAAVVEVYQTPNQKTKSGRPLRWRWRALDGDNVTAKGRHSFRTEAKAHDDIRTHAAIPDGTEIRTIEGLIA